MTEKRAPESDQAEKTTDQEPTPTPLAPGFRHAGLIASEFEIRAEEGRVPKFTGYASLFDVPSSGLEYTEEFAPGAFARSLKAARANYSFVLDHNDLAQIATTRAKNLRLSEDSRGLLVDADLPNVSAANDLRGYYEAGMVRGMSFTFKPQSTEKADGKVRRTTVQLGHVSALVSMEPVYSETGPTVQIRALADSMAADALALDELIDGIRFGRGLTPEEVDLLGQLAAHYNAPRLRTLEDWKALMAAKGIFPH